jgi:hypothetical protein
LVKVRYREGLAIHPDLESCAGVRKGTGEALTGADVSRVSSREIDPNTSGCLRYQDRRGATSGVPLCKREVRSDPARSLDPVRASKHTSRKTGGPMVDHNGWYGGPHHESQGSTMVMNDHGKSDGPILPVKLPNKGGGAPRSAEGVEGRGPAKGNLFQQSRVRTQWREALQHGLERIRQAVNACASEPEVGAQCSSSARWDLCGGRRVTGVPTATKAPSKAGGV